jgi:hypothetical protein
LLIEVHKQQEESTHMSHAVIRHAILAGILAAGPALHVLTAEPTYTTDAGTLD